MKEKILDLLRNKNYRFWITFALIFHFIAAIFSTGHLHPDEHFQILEFLNYKLGKTPVDVLPWEFEAQMRPWIQPFFYYLIVKPLSFIGIDSPFVWTSIFRILSALLGMTSIIFLLIQTKKWFKDDLIIKACVLISCTIWFFPFMHARISSETVGGSLFAIALVFFLNEAGKARSSKAFLIIAGLLLGISFNIRYHAGILIFFTLLHTFIFSKQRLKLTLLPLLGIFLAIGMGIFIDYWGQGSWSLSPWNYLYYNLVEDKASGYGTAPVFAYFKDVFNKTTQPIGLFIILSFVTFWIKRPKHLLTWLTLPFFLIHSLISHKEWRFLYPITGFAPILMAWFYANYLHGLKKFKAARAFGYLTIFVNFLFLTGSSLKSAHVSYDFFKYARSINEKIETFYYEHENPFRLAQLETYFYNPVHHPKGKKFKQENISPQNFNNFEKQTWVFTYSGQGFLKLSQLPNCHLQYLSYPKWVLKFNFFNWLSRSKVWALHKCLNQKKKP